MRGSILVTGGAGYIGSHVALQLRERGEQVVVLDDLSRGFRQAVLDAPLVTGRVGDRDTVLRLLGEHGIDTVMHFAAYAYVGESMENPRKYFQNNVVNSLKLLDAMLELGVKNIVFSSTCATYGMPQELPITEDHPQRPVNPYGEGKLFIDHISLLKRKLIKGKLEDITRGKVRTDYRMLFPR